MYRGQTVSPEKITQYCGASSGQPNINTNFEEREMKTNYDKFTEITVKSQQELDDIPADFEGRIYIEFGTPNDRAVVNKRYKLSVVARENSSVEAWGNSSVEAWGHSSVVARGTSSVTAWGTSYVEARGNSSVVARGNSYVVARGNSYVVAWENSSVEAWEISSVEAWGNSYVEACGNSYVEAWENSSVTACGNVQIVDFLQGSKNKIAGNARIVYNPKSIIEFMDFYGIKHTKTTATFYKAVHKYDDGTYHADYSCSFGYVIGQSKTVSDIDKNTRNECGEGIHISPLAWAVAFGKDWSDLAILEVETKIDNIVLPINTNGKVRTSEVKVIREVPLKECGLYGKILAKRASQAEKNLNA